MTLNIDDPDWYPIASSTDLPFRHVFHGQLLGREFAVWRADDGNVNVWENRCLHRGVRLSIGINEGAELKCQYHGWRYANRSAGCTYIPAHPADAPARRITNRTYPCREAHGLIWASNNQTAPFVDILAAPTHSWLALRPMPVNAEPDAVMAALLAWPNAGAVSQYGLTVTTDPARPVHVFVQPVDAARSVIRGLVDAPKAEAAALLSQFNSRFSAERDQLERAAARRPAPPALEPGFEKVSAELSTMPEIAIGRGVTINVRIARKWLVAEDVTGVELAPLSGHLPTFQPGAHIDLHLPNGMVRQYSVTNGPGELLSYIIGVKREPASRGGSLCLLDIVREGDLLAMSEPRNNFPLRRDSTKTILIAAGIGITPLLSMATALAKSDLPFQLHYFSRSEKHLAFADQLAKFGVSFMPHLGLSRDAIARTIATTLDGYEFSQHVYVCGPAGLLELVRSIAAGFGWPEEAVHFEYFKNDRVIDDSSSFEIVLSRSALTLQVPAGKTILQTMRDNGVQVPSSCEQGACGTCLTSVIEGVPDHQDVYLNETERAGNSCMMTCVSRAKSARLVLDI